MSKKYLCKHLRDVQESYLKHFTIAISCAGQTFIASLVIIIHAICPTIFEKTGSNMLQKILTRIQERQPNNKKSK